METLFVTGGAGFIGGCFVRRLTGRYRVVNYDKLTYAGNLDSLSDVQDHPQYIFHQGDIANASQVLQLLQQYKPAAILNFAAESHVDRSIDAPRAFVQTNVLGTVELLEAARTYWGQLQGEDKDRFRLLHISTDEVYGSIEQGGAFTEQSPYAPASPYAASKAASDHFVRAYFHTYGLPVLLTNCSNNYGPYQFPEKLIPLMILNALEQKPLPVYGDGLNVRDWIAVEDHCDALVAVLNQGVPGETYNVGAGQERTNLQVVEAIAALVDELAPAGSGATRSSLIQFVTDRPGHDRRYAVDSSKAEKQLGWKAKWNFEDGLRRTVQWYIENREWANRVTSGAYRRERLGLIDG